MLNHIVIMGRLVRDPELRTTQTGINVASFTVAVDRDFSGQSGQEKQTDFIDCVAWRSAGEFVSKYFFKGRMIVVSGRLQSRKWQDKEGNNRTSWEVNADNVYFGDSKKDGDSGSTAQNNSYAATGQYSAQGQYSAPAPQSQQSFQELEDDEDDLPF